MTVRRELEQALAICAGGTLPPNVALVHLFLAARDAAEAERALAEASARSGGTPEALRLRGTLALLRQAAGCFDAVNDVLAIAEEGAAAASPAAWAEVFDRAAALSPEIAVAAYALGRPDLLEAANQEVLGRLRAWRLLGADRRVLELGCGIGRLLPLLAHESAMVIGLDISAGMLAQARRRTAGLANVLLLRSSGRDLAAIDSGSLDLVCAVDSFPYLVQAGLAAAHLAEAARVLRPDGALAILNYAYGRDFAEDRDELMALAAAAGLELVEARAGDFQWWDGTSFLLRPCPGEPT